MITCKKVNLENSEERAYYSEQMKDLEQEFTYPLGDKKFYIHHGKENDYFVFFEKLGKPHFLILEDKGKVVGAVCALLRYIDGKKTWYCCDFKISKPYRGQKLYLKLMWKFFVPYYLKSQSMFAVNMSHPENNGLWRHASQIFKAFSVNIKPMYLYEFKKSEAKNLDDFFWFEREIITNNGIKDIVIDSEPLSMYHIVDSHHRQMNLPNHNSISLADIDDDATMMFLFHDKLDLDFAKESVISFIHHKNENLKISSAEI